MSCHNAHISIQAEGTFGIIKNDRWYKRIVRKGIESVKLEVRLVSIGHNLYKYHNKKMRLQEAA
ncbi:MAG: transposase [Oribacterium sp.]|nr:transposase [Oribacterium sp.]MDY6316626.1 transposase [Oribacterium sp.]